MNVQGHHQNFIFTQALNTAIWKTEYHWTCFKSFERRELYWVHTNTKLLIWMKQDSIITTGRHMMY